MPRSEQMMRLLNASQKSVLPVFAGPSNAENRGFVNEAATRLAHSAIICNCSVAALSDDRRRCALNAAIQFIARFRSGQSYNPADLKACDFDESNMIAERILEMFQLVGLSPNMFVRVPGAGIVDSCDVDAIDGDVVIEIKAGNRNCRSEDIRQVLVYSALLELSCQISRVRAVEVLNPRLGWHVSSDVESLLEMAGGRSWGHFRSEFESYVVESRHSNQVIDQIIEPRR
jgi:hypothetical protein